MHPSASGQGPVVRSCGYSNNISNSERGREFLDQLSKCDLLKGQSHACRWLFYNPIISDGESYNSVL